MNGNMRISMLIASYFPRLGGAERQLAAVVPYLQASGMDVQVITRRHRGLPEFEIIDDVQVYRLPIYGSKVSASILFTINGVSVLRRSQPDIIHAHELFSPTTTAILAKKILGVPVVVTAHRSGTIGDVQRLQKKLFGAQRMALFRKEVDAFISISRDIDDELDRAGVLTEKRYFIPNAVDENRFSPLVSKAKKNLRIELGLPDCLIVIFSGRLAPEKRVEHLIDIWPAVREEFPGALLLILGSGINEAELKNQAGDGVRFTGAVKDVVPYLQASDVFVLPSAAEGLSVAMLEAMSTGLPVVVTNVGGATDAIDPGENGMLIPVDDIPALREAIITLLRNEQLRAELGRRARQRIIDRYNLKAVAKTLSQVYSKVALIT